MANFGLLLTSQNVFVAVSDNYKAIKIAQYCVAPQATMLCVDFGTVKNTSGVEINSGNKLDFAGSYRLIKWLDLDSTPLLLQHDYEYSLRTEYGLGPVVRDNFINNLEFLVNYISGTLEFLEFANRKRERTVKRRVAGLVELANFVKMQAGPDPFIDEAVRIESEEFQYVPDAVQMFTQSIVRLLCNINYKSYSLEELQKHIINEIDAIELDYEQKPLSELKRLAKLVALSRNQNV